jgi:predicted metal-dependent phosphoesterase TrpH
LDSIFDLHVHTRQGSADSELDPDVLIGEIHRLGLKGVVLAEHNGWQHHAYELFARRHDIVLIHALEVSTDMGHVIALGLGGYRPGMGNIRHLRKIVDDAGGAMILAHPFRYFFGPRWVSPNLLFRNRDAMPATAAEAAAHAVFGLVDAVEVVNGSYMDERENRFAQDVAAHLGYPGTGGSDAHSHHGIGRGATLFHGDIRHERDLLDALRAGACTPLEGYNREQVSFFGELPSDLRAAYGLT